MNRFNKSLQKMHKLYKMGGVARIVAMLIYRLNRLIYSCDIPPQAEIKNINVLHKGLGVVINQHATIGEKTVIQHGVTIGTLKNETDAPVIEKSCYIGAKATILGSVVIGEGAKIGAGAVVINSIPAGKTAVGVPAKVIN